MEASVKMESSTSPASDWKSAEEELIRGARNYASVIGLLLQDHAPGSPTRALAEEIASSISRVLLVLEAAEKPVVRKMRTVCSPCSDGLRSDITGGKREITPSGIACRQRSHPYARTMITRKTIDDSYSWRKYGQKVINSTTFPRLKKFFKTLGSYYRCTHKYDRGCQATRQVQQSKEDPTMFVITYMGEHTCKSDPIEASTSGSYLISFSSNTLLLMQSKSLPLLKFGSHDEVVTSSSPSEEELILLEDWFFEGSAPTTSPSPPIDFGTSEFDFMPENEWANLDELNFDTMSFSNRMIK